MVIRQLALCLLLSMGTLAAQEPAAVVQVTGAVKQPLQLTAEDFSKMPRASVKTTSNGVQTAYEGVLVFSPGARSVRMLTKLEVVRLRK